MSIEVPMSDVEVVTYNGEELKNLVIDNMKWRKRTNFVPTLNNHTQLSLSRTAGENDNTLDWYIRGAVKSGSAIKVCPGDTLHISCLTTRDDFYCDYEAEEIVVPDVETITREYTALDVPVDNNYFTGSATPYEDLSGSVPEYNVPLSNEGLNAALYPPAQGDHIKISGTIKASGQLIEFTWHREFGTTNSDGSINLGEIEGVSGCSSFRQGGLIYSISPVKLCDPHELQALRVGVTTMADRAASITPGSLYPKLTITSIDFLSESQLSQPVQLSDSMTTDMIITVGFFNKNPLPVTAYITVYDNAMRDQSVGSTSKIVKAREHAELAVKLTSSYDSTSQLYYEVWFEDHDTTKKDFLFLKSSPTCSQ